MIESKWIISLKNKDYPLYAGLLHAATEAGLKELSVKLLQYPSPENGQLAIAEAIAVFEDGRTFCDVGDAGPQNCSAQIASAACRMASTRAKGRALRDALDIGDTMYEELPDEERAQPANGHAPSRQRARHDPADHAAPQQGEPICQWLPGCEERVPAAVAALCRKRTVELGGLILCPPHLEAAAREYKAAAEA